LKAVEAGQEGWECALLRTLRKNFRREFVRDRWSRGSGKPAGIFFVYANNAKLLNKGILGCLGKQKDNWGNFFYGSGGGPIGQCSSKTFLANER
jgi:hypothetical protein